MIEEIEVLMQKMEHHHAVKLQNTSRIVPKLRSEQGFAKKVEIK
jgi:hypothetical protein